MLIDILPKCVIFDCDGVLIDAVRWHYEAFNRALNLFGYSIQPDDHIKVYNGLPTKEKLKIMSEKENFPEKLQQIIRDQKRQYTNDLVALHCKPSYDKIIMLSYLKQKGVKLGCCSNAITESVEDMLKRSHLFNFFQEVIGNDMGFAPKPAPDIYLEAFRRLEVSPEDVWIVEDAPHGVQAAKASGAGRVIEVEGFEQVNLNLFL